MSEVLTLESNIWNSPTVNYIIFRGEKLIWKDIPGKWPRIRALRVLCLTKITIASSRTWGSVDATLLYLLTAGDYCLPTDWSPLAKGRNRRVKLQRYWFRLPLQKLRFFHMLPVVLAANAWAWSSLLRKASESLPLLKRWKIASFLSCSAVWNSSSKLKFWKVQSTELTSLCTEINLIHRSN